MMNAHVQPIGFVSAPRPHAEDDFWGGEEARITLTDPYPEVAPRIRILIGPRTVSALMFLSFPTNVSRCWVRS